METVASSADYLSLYLPIVLFGGLAVAFGVGTLLISHYLQPREENAEKLSPYECGSEPISDARMPFPLRYYVIAVLFVIFDIEVIFLYPWAIDFFRIGLIGLLEMLIFIALFVLAFIYAWRKGALEWE
ncbi:MAG TPA: NADH-quinone oxidoreductase subunit A [Nitrospiria bacterium]|nr:NADH-quinone oxidoreductase subunit A [Nitrospiria bacterium]